MDMIFDLTIEDLTERFDVSGPHLKDSRWGPVKRVVETFYWRDDLTDGDRYSEEFSALLADYFADCRGDHSGKNFHRWRKKQWQLHGQLHDGDSLQTPGLVALPNVEIVDSGPALAGLEARIGNFNQSLEDFDSYFAGVGQTIGGRAVATIAANVDDSIKQGLSNLLSQLSTLGKGN